MGELRSTFIEDGAQTAAQVARDIVAFLEEAALTLDVAIYDFHANTGETATIAKALKAASARGVRVRVAFNTEACTHPADARPMQCDPELIAGLAVSTRGVSTPGSLMHHKYVVRDGSSVWTGSTNWTDDAFTREENVLMTVDSPALAAAYRQNFEKLWAKQHVVRTGGTGEEVVLDHDVRVRPFFTPSPPSLAQLAAARIADADRRVRVVSPVVTSGAVLGTLAELAGRCGSTSTARTTARRWSRSSGSGRRCLTTVGRSRPGDPSRPACRGRCQPHMRPTPCTTTCMRSSWSLTSTWWLVVTTFRGTARSTPRTCSTS